jgi:hypothetical protein
MAFAPNSISSYWATRGNCPPINGKDGATGPAGTNGTNGISVGQNYYFQLSGNIITSTGATGTLQPLPSNVGGNTSYTGYTGPQYSGYYAQTSATGDNVTIAKFSSTAINQSMVPVGPWTMYNNIYSFPAPVGPQPWQVPTSGTPDSKVYATALLQDGSTETQLFKTQALDVSDLNQEVIRFDGGIQTPILINNPTTAYFSIVYTAIRNNPGNVYEFWTQGNSFSHVTTSFGSNQGGTGPVGPTGLQGATGPAGAPGAPGENGAGAEGQLTYYKNTNVIGGTPVATISGITMSITGLLEATNGSNGNGLSMYFVGNSGFIDSQTGIISPRVGAPLSINQSGGISTFGGPINAPTLGLGSFGATNPPAQVNSGQEATIVFAGWRFSWGLTTAITGSNIPYNFITPFASAPITIINPLDGLPTFAVAGTFNRMLITTSATSRFYYVAIGQA